MGATWEEVRSYAVGIFECAEADGSRVAGRIAGQPVFLELTSAWDEPWLLVVSPVAPEHQVTRPVDALRWSAQLAVGGLVIIDDMLAVRATLCLSELELTSLIRYVTFVAREAHRLASLHDAWGPPERAVDFLAD